MGKLSLGRAARHIALTILSIVIVWAGDVRAHQVQPTMADFTVEGSLLSFEFTLNAEAFLSGLTQDGLGDTDDGAREDVYDRLRALDADGLEDRFVPFFQAWLDEVGVDVSGPVALSVASFDAGPMDDPAFARSSTLVVQGQIPPLAPTMTVNWPMDAGVLVLRQLGVEKPYTGIIEGGRSSGPIPLDGGAPVSGWTVFSQYVTVGFNHIVPLGADHILFVLGLFFLGPGWRTLLWQVSAFTLAHTATLALGAAGLVQVPPALVEPLIALSIVYVGVENIFLGHLTRLRPVVIFAFGLLHGLGFAGVLAEFGMPRSQFVPALLGFNLGVEFGQLAVIAAAFLAVGLWFGAKPWYRRRIANPASAVIAMIGAYWFLEQVIV